MILIEPLPGILAGAVVLLIVMGSTALFFVGLRGRMRFADISRYAERTTSLLQSAPAIAIIVSRDGRLEMPRQLEDLFGLPAKPNYLDDLCPESGGLSPEDVAALADHVANTRRSGRSFSMTVRPRQSGRAFVLHGIRIALAPDSVGNVIIWVSDTTKSETEITRLRAETNRLITAFEAMTGLIEAAPLPIWYRGPDLKLAMVNSAYVAAVEGSDRGDVVERGVELIEASVGDGPLAGAAAAQDENCPQTQVLPATIDGERRSLRLYDVPLPAGGVAGFAIDIEDLEQSHIGAKRFAEAQRAMLDRLSAGVVQFAGDRTLVFCNQPFRRMFAMRSEWLADRPEFERVLERMREANRLPEVRDFPGWKAERQSWFTGGDAAIEEQWHLLGGTHLRVVAQPLPDGGLMLIFEDQTEQVQLASARDTLLRVRTATFDNLFEALGVFAADGRLQLWNNRFRALWGFEDEFLAAHPRVDVFAKAAADRLVTPARSELIPELVRSATRDRQQRGGRVAFADGRHFEFAGVPLPDGNALFTMLDITDSKRAEKALRDRNNALEDADRVKTAFVANMSYELRTPLTSIGGFAEMLHGGYAGELPSNARVYVEAILESVERLGLLIDDVLDLTRGDVEGSVREDVDLMRTAREAAAMLETMAKRRKLDFAVELSRSGGRVTGDPRRLREAIEHVLRHVIESAPEGTRILLHLDGTATAARIVVSDNGPGADAETVAKAFDRFAEPGTRATGERALGLGLPLARQFIEAHGGTVELISEPGQGTLITITIPRR